MSPALLVVDVQNDFLPSGALGVRDGDAVIPVANRLIRTYPIVVATKDWHPADHESFASQHPGRHVGDVIDLHGLQQILWPDHCVQGTPGAEFAPGLVTDRFDAVFHKGTDRTIDSYSAFFDNAHRRSTGLGEWLARRDVSKLHLVGLATDYCVRFSALDALELGLDVTVVREGVRAVDLLPGDGDRALAELEQAGAHVRGVDEVDPG